LHDYGCIPKPCGMISSIVYITLLTTKRGQLVPSFLPAVHFKMISDLISVQNELSIHHSSPTTMERKEDLHSTFITNNSALSWL